MQAKDSSEAQPTNSTMKQVESRSRKSHSRRRFILHAVGTLLIQAPVSLVFTTQADSSRLLQPLTFFLNASVYEEEGFVGFL